MGILQRTKYIGHFSGILKNIHFFERPFKCESCSVSFKTKGMLEKHERSESHISKLQLRKDHPLPKVVENSRENPRPYR